MAELVAGAAPPSEVFAAVAAEASWLLCGQAMTLTRFEERRELVVVASRGGPAAVGEHIVFEPGTLPDRVRRRAAAVRVDDYRGERDVEMAAAYGIAAAVAAPVAVAGQVWGMLTATSGVRPLRAGTEDRLEQFARLVAAAVGASQARAELQALADEQAALRRVAELAARGAPIADVLDAVAVEGSRLSGVEFTALVRFEPDGSSEVVALVGARRLRPAPPRRRNPRVIAIVGSSVAVARSVEGWRCWPRRDRRWLPRAGGTTSPAATTPAG